MAISFLQFFTGNLVPIFNEKNKKKHLTKIFETVGNLNHFFYFFFLLFFFFIFLGGPDESFLQLFIAKKQDQMKEFIGMKIKHSLKELILSNCVDNSTVNDLGKNFFYFFQILFYKIFFFTFFFFILEIDLFSQMLNPNMHKRISVSETLEHPLFNDLEVKNNYIGKKDPIPFTYENENKSEKELYEDLCEEIRIYHDF